MATNEHFLLVAISNFVHSVDRVVYSVDEAIHAVNNARIHAGMSSGSKVALFVQKALRKLDHNNLIRTDGQLRFRITRHGANAFKRAMKECPLRSRRTPRSSLSTQAREVLRVGSFLRKRLIRETDDIIEELKVKYRTLKKRRGLIRLDGEVDDKVWFAEESTARVSPERFDRPWDSSPTPDTSRAGISYHTQARLFSEGQAAEYLDANLTFRDILSESEAELLPRSASGSDSERRSVSVFDEQCYSTSRSSRQSLPSTPRYLSCAPRDCSEIHPDCGTDTLACEVVDAKGGRKATAGATATRPNIRYRLQRKRSFDSDETLVDPSPISDPNTLSSTNMTPFLLENWQDTKPSTRSSVPESTLINGISLLHHTAKQDRRTRRNTQGTSLRNKSRNVPAALYHPYREIDSLSVIRHEGGLRCRTREARKK